MKQVGAKQPNNAQRDLMRKLKKDAKLPEAYYADIPAKDRTTGNKTTTRLQLLLLSEMLCLIMLAFSVAYKDIGIPSSVRLCDEKNRMV